MKILNLSRHFSTTALRNKSIRIGCASGFWGDTPTAVPQLLNGGKLDYLMFDYLSEVTMSLMTASKAKNPDLGYAPDFVLFAVGPHLKQIKDQNVKIIANAGGINTLACVEALKQASKKAGVDLKIASVTGDDMMPMRKQLMSGDPISVQEMSTGQVLPKTIHSMTAYFGAGPIAEAFKLGADIVVTGRTADSALALAPCVHEFNWDLNKDWDLLASGSLAGHLVECGGQGTGGLFTDWQQVSKGYANLGFPIIEMQENGDFALSKPAKTGGIINEYAVAEQMLYEVGDPANYILPDVICDFTQVKMSKPNDQECIKVSGAKGKPPTKHFKVSATYMDGFKATSVALIGGGDAAGKGHAVADAILARSRAIFKALKMPDFTNTYITAFGNDESYGANAKSKTKPREVALWMAVQHPDKKALDIWAREIASAGTGMAPGLCQLVGGRPKPSPCLKLFSFLFPKTHLPAKIQVDENSVEYLMKNDEVTDVLHAGKSQEILKVEVGDMTYSLEELAYARSGDKGDSCNIGIIARDPKYLPYIKKYLTEESVQEFFKHFVQGKVTRFDVPGINGVNFLLEQALGGGGIASLRPDPLGKSFAQMLLSFELTNMPKLK